MWDLTVIELEFNITRIISFFLNQSSNKLKSTKKG